MLQVEWNNQDKKNGFNYDRKAGNKVVAPLEVEILPWALVVDNATASASGYNLSLNRDIDFVREIRLVAVVGSDATSRRVRISDRTGGQNFLDASRTHAVTSFDGELLLTPGANLGSGWVVKSWRDSGGKIPREINVTQKNVDGTAFTGDHKIALLFNVTTTRFQ